MDDLRQYRYFLTVVEEGSFRRAAEKLDLTHGAISQTIRRLEDIYRVKLFDRTKKGMKPTPYGRLLIEKAKQAIDLFETFQIEVQRLENRQLGNLVNGCDPLLTQTIVGPAVTRLLQAYPSWSFEVRSIPWEQMSNSFETRQVSIYVGFLLPRMDVSRHSVERIQGIPGVFVCRPDHPLASRKGVSLLEVAEDFFAYFPLPPSIETVKEEYSTFIPKRRMVTNDAGLLKQIILSSDTVCGVMLHLFVDELDRGELKLINVKDTDLYGTVEEYRSHQNEDGHGYHDIQIVTHKTQMPIPAALEFKKAIRDVIDERVSEYDELRQRYLDR